MIEDFVTIPLDDIMKKIISQMPSNMMYAALLTSSETSDVSIMTFGQVLTLSYKHVTWIQSFANKFIMFNLFL